MTKRVVATAVGVGALAVHSTEYDSGERSSFHVATRTVESSTLWYPSLNSLGVTTFLFWPGALVFVGDLLLRGTVVVVGVAIVVVGEISSGIVVEVGAVVVVTGVSSSTKLAIVRFVPVAFLAVKVSLMPLDEIPG